MTLPFTLSVYNYCNRRIATRWVIMKWPTMAVAAELRRRSSFAGAKTRSPTRLTTTSSKCSLIGLRGNCVLERRARCHSARAACHSTHLPCHSERRIPAVATFRNYGDSLSRRRKSRHSRERGNPPDVGPACAGTTPFVTFWSIGWPQAYGHSEWHAGGMAGYFDELSLSRAACVMR